MKLIHLSDLHLGKRVNECSMLADQQYILAQILDIIRREAPDGVIIAGDVYDKSVPPAEAVGLLDDFLTALAALSLPVFLISGNHDSPERLAFGGRLLAGEGIHLSPVYSGTVEPIRLEDEFGGVDFYLLPFVKPAHVRPFFPDRDIRSYQDAIACAVEQMHPDPSLRSVLVTHQFVTGAQRCDSEEISVGGTDNVDAALFDAFDYVALGHLHGPQSVGRETVRYCGTPLKYSFSEAGQNKSVTVVELKEKGTVIVRTVPLTPRRDMVELRGTYDQLTLRSFYEGTGWQEDYVHITLTDEEDILDAASKLRTIYHNLMKLSYDNRRTRAQSQIEGADPAARKSPLTLFEEFYEIQNGQPMSQVQRGCAQQLMEEIWEGTV